MVQYNPYAVKLRGRLWKLDYLVGVATEESRRREGHFRDVFVKMLHDEEAAGKPITYLVPVNPAVYAPMGFTFIGNVASYELTEKAKQTLTRTVCQDTPEDCGRAAVYMEQWLGARYEMYTRRDAAYVSRLIKELASEMARWNSWNRTAGWLAWMPTGAGKSVNTGFCMRRTHTRSRRARSRGIWRA